LLQGLRLMAVADDIRHSFHPPNYASGAESVAAGPRPHRPLCLWWRQHKRWPR
jgi:hypothetical protein